MSRLGDIKWQAAVFATRWRLRLLYALRAPFIYRNWWAIPACYLGSGPVVLELRNGIRFELRPRSGDLGVINEMAMLNPYFKPGHVRLRDDSIVVDVGANIGDFSIQASRACPAGTVFAIEPVPEHCRLIERQIELNRVGNVKVFQGALGGVEGDQELFMAGSKSSIHWGEGSRIKVHVETLERFMQTHGIARIDLLKLDCEGAEWDILPASEALLPRISQICMEYHNGKLDAAWLQQWLEDRGFEVWRTQGPWCGGLWARRR